VVRGVAYEEAVIGVDDVLVINLHLKIVYLLCYVTSCQSSNLKWSISPRTYATLGVGLTEGAVLRYLLSYEYVKAFQLLGRTSKLFEKESLSINRRVRNDD